MKNSLETRLGVFFALALIVSVVILEMIGAADFLKRGYIIKSSFRNVQELKKGDQVKLAGVEVGRVEEVSLLNNRAVVQMKIQNKYGIPTDSKAVIRFTGLMGQNFIAIDAGSAATVIEKDGGTLESKEQPDLGAIMEKMENVATGIEGLAKSFSPDNFSTLLGPITDFMKQNSPALTAVLGNMKTVSDNLVRGHGTVGRLLTDDSLFVSAYGAITNLQIASADFKGLTTQASSLLTRAGGIVDQVNAGQGTLGKLARDEALYLETTSAMANLRQILQKINDGQGSVGKLVNDESFLKNAKLTLQKVDKATDSLEDQGPLSVLGIAISTLF